MRIGERGGPAPLTEVSAEILGSATREKNMEGHEGFRLAEFTYPLLEGKKKKGKGKGEILEESEPWRGEVLAFIWFVFLFVFFSA